jgi:D-serine deaminase-like pyridoxal phosphate-dependent protein
VDALGLDTPAPYVDLDVLERNLRRMQDLARSLKVALRPHAKTHKIPEIARMQVAIGAVGITVAKVGEAEALPADDVLVAYPLTPEKAARARELARTRRVSVAVDSVEAARAAEGLPALVEVDVGFGRCGVQTPEAFVAAARACRPFRGLFYYLGGLEEAAYGPARTKIRACLDAAKAAGLAVEVVSGGSTPGAARTPLIPETTEIRPGTYAYHDAGTVARGLATPDDCAFRVLVSVVSASVPGQCVVDGGSKTFSFNATKIRGGYGDVAGRPWKLDKLNDEHGFVLTDGAPPPRVGERLWIIPGHVGTCVNQHDEVWYGRAGKVEGKWTVAARGRVR